MSRAPADPTIAPRVLRLCQQSLTMSEIVDHFPAHDATRARYAVYNLVKRGLLRNEVEGKCGPHRSGRFVVTEAAPAMEPERHAPRGTGIELARAWGLLA